MSRVSYIEIVLPVCQLSYGQSPCTASIGATGARKCFNTLATCQDTQNIALADQVIRFSTASIDNNPDIVSIPNIVSVEYTPPEIMLGEGVGARSSISVTFRDHPTPDTGVGGDPYYKERNYDPYHQGTFWGKFVTRYRFLRGAVVRWYIGDAGDRLERLEKREFLLENIEGPDTNGQVKLIAKDPLTLLDSKRARSPAVSRGIVASDITNIDTTILINPTGIVAEDYDLPLPYYISAGGEEIMQVTSVDTVADQITVTRGVYGTEAVSHDFETRLQVALFYDSEKAQDIIYDLMINYGNINPAFINRDDWDNEVDNFLGTIDIPAVYTALMPEPTPVVDLVNELCQQAGMHLWWDDIRQKISLQVLRFLPSPALPYNDDIIMAGSFRQKEQQGKRVSQVWVYYSQDDPLESLDEPANYREAVVQQSSLSAFRYGTPSVKQIFSRWVPKGGFDVAAKVTQLLLARYAQPPRLFRFSILRDPLTDAPELGEGRRIQSSFIQDDTGLPQDIECQITSIKTTDSIYQCTAEEITRSDYDEIQANSQVILVTITANYRNLNLRNLFDNIRSIEDVQENDEIRFVIRSGVRIGSSTFSSALRVGDWSDLPSGAFLTLQIFEGAFITGRPGRGGFVYLRDDGIAFQTAPNGSSGGLAFLADYPITVDNSGTIGGGGGGGGAAGAVTTGSDTRGIEAVCLAAVGGGSGAGYPPVDGGLAGVFDEPDFSQSYYQDIKNGQGGTLAIEGASQSAEASRTVISGDGFIKSTANGGGGGGLGEAGQSATAIANGDGSNIAESVAGAGGAAGAAISGDSNITWVATGFIFGAVS